jgi:hypothetical protein
MKLAIALLLVACGGAPGPRGEGGALPSPGRSVAVYSSGGAIVVDRRWVEVGAGASDIELGGLPARLVPASLTMRALGGGLAVRARWFDPGLASSPAESILAESIGREIEIEAQGARLRGRLVAVRGGEIVLDQRGQLRTVPWRDAGALSVAGRRRGARPSLRARVEAGRSGRHMIELVYATEGLSFQVSYGLRMTERGAELRAWAHLENASGLDLGGARLALHAGRLGAREPDERPVAFWSGPIELAASGSDRVERRQLEMPRAAAPTSRVEAVYRGAVPDLVNPVTEPVFGTGSQGRVVRHLLFTVDQAVLPPGPAIIELGPDESARLSSRLEARVLAGGQARFELDADPMLSGERRQLQIQRSADGQELTESYELIVRNRGPAPAAVRVIEPLARSRQVTLDRAEPAPAAQSERAVEWLLQVPAGGEAKATLEATYRF